MKRLIGMTAALVLAATATSASAQTISATDRADMQCFVLIAAFAGQAEENNVEQAGLVGGMMYFLGRLEGRTPGTDWLKALADYLTSFDDAGLDGMIESQRERCGGILIDRGQAMEAWGTTIAAAAEAAGN